MAPEEVARAAELSTAVARVDKEGVDASIVEFVEWAKRYADEIDPLFGCSNTQGPRSSPR
jgi:hypothetical protein